MSAPVFLVPRQALTSGDVVSVGGAEAHHASVVRRLRVGERVDLTDGAGLVVHGTVDRAERDLLVVAVASRLELPVPSPRLVVAQALPKGERGELAVELMTEVGVDEILPWSAERCITVWRDDRVAKGLARWRGSAMAAAKQSRRWWHPSVADLVDTGTLAGRVGRSSLALVLHESAEASLADVVPPVHGEVLLVVGPEGGLTADELDVLAGAGARPVRVGPTVMRTSTAGAVAAGVLLSRTPRWGADRVSGLS